MVARLAVAVAGGLADGDALEVGHDLALHGVEELPLRSHAVRVPG